MFSYMCPMCFFCASCSCRFPRCHHMLTRFLMFAYSSPPCFLYLPTCFLCIRMGSHMFRMYSCSCPICFLYRPIVFCMLPMFSYMFCMSLIYVIQFVGLKRTITSRQPSFSIVGLFGFLNTARHPGRLQMCYQGRMISLRLPQLPRPRTLRQLLNPSVCMYAFSKSNVNECQKLSVKPNPVDG